jgi:putative SOS response-associated peptidase YedK
MRMCGRFALSAMLTEIAEEFSTSALPDRTLPFDWNIKPTQDIYIIKESVAGDGSNKREIDVVSWGLIAPWSKTGDDAYRSQSQAINARWESVHEKPTFKSSFQKRRCLIPASGYFEWATELSVPSKQPFYITSESNQLLAFTGIYSSWKSPEGVMRKSAALITRDAQGALAKIHNRMPLFLPKDRWSQWLDPKVEMVTELRDLMTLSENSAESHEIRSGINHWQGLKFWPVSKSVNSIRNNGPELIEIVSWGEPETLF